MTKGKTLLRITGFLELLLGVASIALAIILLQSNETTGEIIGISVAKDALWGLVLLYAYSGFQILAGIVGLLFAGNARKAGICKFFGSVLILIAIATTAVSGFSLQNIMYYALHLIIPVFFYYGALLNSK